LGSWAQKGPFPVPGTPGATGFYINPSRRGPAVPGGGWLGGPPGEPLRGLPGSPSGTPSRDPVPGDPPPGTAGPRREGLM